MHYRPPVWANTQHNAMAYNCMTHTTYRFPPTCRLLNDSGSCRVASLFSIKFLQGRSQTHGAQQASYVGLCMWANTQHMAHDCMPHAAHRSPSTCRLLNDSVRVFIIPPMLMVRVLQGRSQLYGARQATVSSQASSVSNFGIVPFEPGASSPP